MSAWAEPGRTGGGVSAAGQTLLIPKDYRGELLRGPGSGMPAERDRTERAADRETTSAVMLPTEETEGAETTDALDGDTSPVSAQVSDGSDRQREPEDTEAGSGHSLLGGFYDLLIGKNSTEEETVLLLGIAVLLLWGHLDRGGGSFEIGTWGEEDLALLLIGYLLLS